jgi:hypothetical protein
MARRCATVRGVYRGNGLAVAALHPLVVDEETRGPLRISARALTEV